MMLTYNKSQTVILHFQAVRFEVEIILELNKEFKVLHKQKQEHWQ